MTYKTRIWEELSKNTGLRLRIALALNVGETAVIRAIQRKSKSLLRYQAVQVIREEMQLSDEELFEQELEPSK